MDRKAEVIFLGGGCFWCLEAVFNSLEGVVSVTSGYMGGSIANPTYSDVCLGAMGHAEVIKVIFENFGPDRILFGSDWPVCLLASNYKNVLGIIINYFKDYDPEVKKKIFGGNAKIFYNLL